MPRFHELPSECHTLIAKYYDVSLRSDWYNSLPDHERDHVEWPLVPQDHLDTDFEFHRYQIPFWWEVYYSSKYEYNRHNSELIHYGTDLIARF